MAEWKLSTVVKKVSTRPWRAKEPKVLMRDQEITRLASIASDRVLYVLTRIESAPSVLKRSAIVGAKASNSRKTVLGSM